MGERAKKIDVNRLTPEEIGKIKSVWSRVAQMDTITVATGSILSEIFADVPEVFAEGRFIIVKTKYRETIGMVNPEYKTVGVNVEYTDLYKQKRSIAVRNLDNAFAFKQCMLALDGVNLRETTSDILKGVGSAAVDFAKGPGKEGAKKVGQVAWSGTKKAAKGFKELCDWVVEK